MHIFEVSMSLWEGAPVYLNESIVPGKLLFSVENMKLQKYFIYLRSRRFKSHPTMEKNY